MDFKARGAFYGAKKLLKGPKKKRRKKRGGLSGGLRPPIHLPPTGGDKRIGERNAKSKQR